jgi:hypothetical protein
MDTVHPPTAQPDTRKADTRKADTRKAGTGAPAGGHPSWGGGSPAPGGRSLPAAPRARPYRRARVRWGHQGQGSRGHQAHLARQIRRVHPARGPRPGHRVQPGRNAPVGPFPAGRVVRPGIRVLASREAGPDGSFRGCPGNHPARLRAADGAPGLGPAVARPPAGRPPAGRPTPYRTSLDPAKRPGAGPRPGAERWRGWAAAHGLGAPGRPTRPAVPRRHSPVPGLRGARSGGAQDGRQPGTSHGRVRRHHVAPGTS